MTTGDYPLGECANCIALDNCLTNGFCVEECEREGRPMPEIEPGRPGWKYARTGDDYLDMYYLDEDSGMWDALCESVARLREK